MNRHQTRAQQAGRRLLPANPDQLIRLGIQAHSAGQLKDALSLYAKALKNKPDHPEGNHLTALVLRDLGDRKQALKHLRIAQHALSQNAMFLNNLGLVLQELAEFDEAVQILSQATTRDPSLAMAYNNLGLAQRGRNNIAEAEKAFAKAIELQPDLAPAHNNLGLCQLDKKLFAQAATSFEAAVNVQPGYTEAWNNLGIAYRHDNRSEQARSAFEKALSIRPDHLNALTNLGIQITTNGNDYELALKILDKAIAAGATNPDLAFCRATALSMLGEKDQAIAACRQILAKNTQDGRTWHKLVSLLGSKERVAVRNDVESAYANTPLSHPDRIELAFALGLIEDAAKCPAQAIDHYNEGNRLHRSTYDYDSKNDDRVFARIKNTFTKELLETHKASGNPDQAPIFILGMPRSGTSLVEQILASHSAVQGLGELSELGAVAARAHLHPGNEHILGAEALTQWLPVQFAELGSRYLQLLRKKAPNAQFMTDKMPHNFRFVGLIKLILPNAKIIHCRRNAADTCISLYKILFHRARQQFASDFNELAHHYALYADLMDYWRDVLPDSMYEISYEDLVADPEPQMRALLAHCGLDWEPGVREFHRNERKVYTASFDQVRKPIYQSAVNSAARYGEAIQPLLDALNNAPHAHIR